MLFCSLIYCSLTLLLGMFAGVEPLPPSPRATNLLSPGKKSGAHSGVRNRRPVKYSRAPIFLDEVDKIATLPSGFDPWKWYVTEFPEPMDWVEDGPSEMYTVALQDKHYNTFCTGAALCPNRVLTTCKCTYKMDYDEIPVRPGECPQPSAYIIVGGGSFCKIVREGAQNPEHFVEKVVTQKSCRKTDAVWVNDLAIIIVQPNMQASDSLNFLYLPRERRLRSEYYRRAIFEASGGERISYHSFVTFNSKKSPRTEMVYDDFDYCNEQWDNRLDPDLRGKIVCSDDKPEENMACSGSEGAVAHYSFFHDVHFILSDVGNCTFKLPNVWTKLQPFFTSLVMHKKNLEEGMSLCQIDLKNFHAGRSNHLVRSFAYQLGSHVQLILLGPTILNCFK